MLDAETDVCVHAFIVNVRICILRAVADAESDVKPFRNGVNVRYCTQYDGRTAATHEFVVRDHVKWGKNHIHCYT